MRCVINIDEDNAKLVQVQQKDWMPTAVVLLNTERTRLGRIQDTRGKRTICLSLQNLTGREG